MVLCQQGNDAIYLTELVGAYYYGFISVVGHETSIPTITDLGGNSCPERPICRTDQCLQRSRSDVAINTDTPQDLTLNLQLDVCSSKRISTGTQGVLNVIQ